jgi:phosphoglycolate phosphatase
MRIKAILFDLDGTLIDSVPDIADAANRLMRNHQYPVHDTSTYTEWIGNGALKLIERAVPGGSDTLYRELLDEYLEIYKDNCTNKTRLYPGIDEMLSFLNDQHISVSVLTNKPHAVTLKVFEHYLSKWKFDFVQGQSQEYPKKPDPQVAVEIAAKLNCSTREMLLIGDSDTDIKTAVNAGMVPVGVAWGYDTESSMVNAGAEYLVYSAAELLRFLKSNIL